MEFFARLGLVIRGEIRDRDIADPGATLEILEEHAGRTAGGIFVRFDIGGTAVDQLRAVSSQVGTITDRAC